MQLISKNAVVARLGVSLRTLDRMLADESGPPATGIGRRVMFREDKFNAWLRSK